MPSEKTNIHSGHRDRMRSRLSENGPDAFLPHELLELLLFCVIPKRDVNPLAHALLEEFGTISAVLSASCEELEKIDGVGRQTAEFLSSLNALMELYKDTRHMTSGNLATIADALRYVPASARTALKHGMTIIFTDRLNRPLAVHTFPGRPNDPAVIRSILAKTLALHAHSVIIFCTGYRSIHPLGRKEVNDLQPLISALAGINTFTIDCILLSNDHLASMRREKLLTGHATGLQSKVSTVDYWLGVIASAKGSEGWYPLSLIESPAKKSGGCP